MATKSKRVAHQLSRANISGLRIRSIAAQTARDGIANLNAQLRTRYRQELVIRQRAERESANALAPLITIVQQDKTAAQALLRRRRLLDSRPKPKPAYPKVLKNIESHLRAGSILNVVTAPYDYAWGDHSPDNQQTWGTWGADSTRAEFSTTDYVHSGGSAWASAGIGTYFVPAGTRGSTYVRVGLYAPYNYDWSDDSSFETAHTDGFMGIFVQSWDLNGGDPQIEIDRRISLWSDGSDWTNSHSDSGSGYYPSDTYFFAWSSRQYAIWAWCNTSGDGSSGSIAYSYASGQISVSMPFMVIEQWI